MPLGYRACILDPSGFGLPLPGLPADFTTDPLASNNQFQPGRHFRGCGFISARLEPSRVSNRVVPVRLILILQRSKRGFYAARFWGRLLKDMYRKSIKLSGVS